MPFHWMLLKIRENRNNINILKQFSVFILFARVNLRHERVELNPLLYDCYVRWSVFT